MPKLKEKKSSAELSNKMDALFYNLNDSKNTKSKKIAIPTVEGLSFVLVSEIVRCQSDTNYTHIYLLDNRKITAAKTLKHFESILESYNFFRIHHSHLINIELVDKYMKGKGGYLLMMDGSSVEVAVRRKDEFLKRIM